MYKGIPITAVIPTHSILLPDSIHVSCGSLFCFLRPSEFNRGHLPDHGYGIVHWSLMGCPSPRAHQYPVVFQQAGGPNVDNSTSRD